MAQKFVEIRMTVVVEYDDSLFDENDVINKSVLCFLYEDKLGVENFLPSAIGLNVIDYLETEGNDVTEEYTEK